MPSRTNRYQLLWWSHLFNPAIEGENSTTDKIRAGGINFIAICWLPVIISYAVFCLTTTNWHYGLLLFMFFGIQWLVPVFNSAGNLKLAAIVYLLTINFVIILMNVVFEFNYGTYYYLFPLFASLSFLYSWPKYKRIFLLMLIIMLTTHLCSFIWVLNTKKELSYPIQAYSFLSYNFIGSFILTFVFFWRFNVLKSRQKIELDHIIIDNIEKQYLLEEALKDRNILLSEIHHRTKNNLAIISSMLNLQRHQIKDEKMRNILLDCSNRVHSMASVHQKLYERGDFTKIDFREYTEGLIHDLRNTLFPKGIPIKVRLTIDSFPITSDKAIPFSLILNEVITNSVKYAFDHSGGVIQIKISRISNQVLVMIHDNGKGFDVEQAKAKGSLGMTLIEALTEQLDGKFEFNVQNGTTFTMNFSLV